MMSELGGDIGRILSYKPRDAGNPSDSDLRLLTSEIKISL